MKRLIRLVDIPEIETPDHREYSRELLERGRAALVGRNLRYDNATGIIRDNSGELERFKKQADHVPHNTEQDVMRWEFSRYINNAASRISRGYAP